MGKTAIITGVSGGIGKAISLRHAADRFNVVLHYPDESHPVKTAIKQIEEGAGKRFHLQKVTES